MNEVQLNILSPLVYSALLLIVFGTVIGLSRFYFVGTKKFSYATLTPGAPQGPRWYSSLNRVYINGIEALALFAPAVLIHFFAHSNIELLRNIMWVYFFGRLAYSVVYILGGYTIVCSFCWLVGFVATLFGWLLILA